MNIFTLAKIELQREKKDLEGNIDLFFDRAKKIRHYLDLQERNKQVANNRR